MKLCAALGWTVCCISLHYNLGCSRKYAQNTQQIQKKQPPPPFKKNLPKTNSNKKQTKTEFRGDVG